jgi:hypothetical protein
MKAMRAVIQNVAGSLERDDTVMGWRDGLV